MAKTLWGKIYYKDIYAGRLQEESGGRCVFTYNPSYLEAGHPAIAYTLPLRPKPYISERGLHPFFDNLVAEGWFRNAQAKALDISPNNRFALLLGFGHDLAGAVSVIDPEPQELKPLDPNDEAAAIAALLGRASLSGVQRKLLVVKEGKQYRPVKPNELSTHIAKLPSGNLTDLTQLEYLITQAVRALMPDDTIVDMEIATLPAINEEALIIPRFDRTPSGKQLYHFEEFNQLLGRYSGDDKYEGNYEEMGKFILGTPNCIPAESDRLLRRIIACLLVGNTDAHFKNFAMFHTPEGLRLTPAYDLVAASYYPSFQAIALKIGNTANLAIGSLLPKHIVALGKGFQIREESLLDAMETFEKRLPKALETLERSNAGSKIMRDTLKDRIEKRWNGSFASIGQLLSKKQNKGEKNKN